MKCKKELLMETALDRSLTEKPLIGMISRLDKQKGLDILMPVLEDVLKLDACMILLGSGDEQIEIALRKAADRNPGRMAIFTGFNNPLAHRIMAGADIFLIPSRYEPCGLTQMYALKYGTVPVVRATGGLNDTIEQYDNQKMKGTGFKFVPYDSIALLDAVKLAVRCYKDKIAWKRLMSNGMKSDFSWERSAEKYLDIYGSIVKG
jgi:starch synthase